MQGRWVGAVTRPWCHNRRPWSDLHHAGDMDRGIPPTTWPHLMSHDCGSWKDVQDGGKGPQAHPVRSGWECDGCRWRPIGDGNGASD